MPIADQTWANIVAQTLGHDDLAISSDMSVNRARPTYRDTTIPLARILRAMRTGEYAALEKEYPEFTADMVPGLLDGLIRLFEA